MPNSISHPSLTTHNNTHSADESLGFFGDTAIKILCITAYPGVLAADLVTRFPKVMAGFIAFNLFNSASSAKLADRSLNTASLSQEPAKELNHAINECNQYKPKTNDIYAIRAHTQCLLSLTKKHYPESHLPHQLTPKDYRNLKQISYALPAANLMDQLNKNPTINHENHTNELLKFVLGIPVSENPHHDLRHLCGLDEMFNLSQQAKDMLLLFVDDIKSLINDKKLTEPMVKVFQTEFLERYRNKIPFNISEGIKLGFESFWRGGPAESALLIQALYRINLKMQA